ncbi:MAG: thrombospondin type 3 repeat-containing protein [Myxococcota bacterium]
MRELRRRRFVWVALGATALVAGCVTYAVDGSLEEPYVRCPTGTEPGCRCVAEGQEATCATFAAKLIGVGTCREGKALCARSSDGNLAYGACEGEVAPEDETCANLGEDNDCDGIADEVEVPGPLGEPCNASGQLGLCALGVSACEGGQYFCRPAQPQPEECNGKDDNCDGTVDEGFADLDGDQRADCVDDDADGDGIPNRSDRAPLNAFSCSDTDGDTCDDCAVLGRYAPFDDGKDFDADGKCDQGDDDIDGDGWSNAEEVRCLTDAKNSASLPVDRNNNGTCDNLEGDTDADGWPDAYEIVCGSDLLDPLSLPLDTDGDGLCNSVDPDDDADGVSDSDEVACLTDPLDAVSRPPQPTGSACTVPNGLGICGNGAWVCDGTLNGGSCQSPPRSNETCADVGIDNDCDGCNTEASQDGKCCAYKNPYLALGSCSGVLRCIPGSGIQRCVPTAESVSKQVFVKCGNCHPYRSTCNDVVGYIRLPKNSCMNYVEPFSTTYSYFYHKMGGTNLPAECGGGSAGYRMPPGGLTSGEWQTFVDWVQGGADTTCGTSGGAPLCKNTPGCASDPDCQ